MLTATMVATPASAQTGQTDSVINLNQSSGLPGTAVQIKGQGYQPGESVQVYIHAPTVKSSPIPAGQTIVDAHGNFGPTDFTIPATMLPGKALLVARGMTSGTETTHHLIIPTWETVVNVEEKGQTPLSPFTVSGSKFAALEPVSITLAGQSTTVTTDETGSFSLTNLTIPIAPTGTYQLTARGQHSGSIGRDYVYISPFYPTVKPSSYYILPEQSLSFSGSGFAPGEDIHIIPDGFDHPIATTTSDARGTFTAGGMFTVPGSFKGAVHTLLFQGKTSQTNVKVMVTVGDPQSNQIIPSRYWVSPGETLQFSGTGFRAFEVVTILDASTKAKLDAVFTDANGNFQEKGNVKIPASFADSTRLLLFVGEQSHMQNFTKIMIDAFHPSITPSSYYLKVGSELGLFGQGFDPNEAVTLHIGDAQEPLTLTTDQYGMFQKTITIPQTATGQLTLLGQGVTSSVPAMTTITLAQ
jgi:hypothetical protein